jgi:CO/xanthine dehydrogenase FAD-binding subunit
MRPDRLVEDARIILGAVHVAPLAATGAARFLIGRTLDRETIEMAAGIAFKPAKPLDNTDLTHLWRKRMVRVEVSRALTELIA